MGLLDDAIREHLDLKRKHGAASDDVERLEKEAFGPATRPGDPEFEGEEGPDAEAALAEPAEAGSGDWADVLEENTEDHVERGGGTDVVDEAEAELSPAEQARIERADLDDTVDHPAVPEEGGPEAEAFEEEEAPSGEEPAEPPEAAIFDESDEFELELELDDEEEPETGSAEPPSGEAEAVGFEADDSEEDELEDEDEDLLEETPDFLEDTPEGERLWFEQGEPKDFDFDD